MNTTSTKPQITFEEFMAIEAKLEIRIGKIVIAEKVPKSNGLKLTVDFGGDIENLKTAFTNIGKYFAPEALIGLTFPFIMNLEPIVIKGVTSEVMIMVADSGEGEINLDQDILGSKLM